MDLICTVPRPHLLGRALIWPGYFGATSFGYPSSSSKSAGFVSPAWKSSLVSISDAILFLRFIACLFTVGVRISWKR